jgi:hypothetical protein
MSAQGPKQVGYDKLMRQLYPLMQNDDLTPEFKLVVETNIEMVLVGCHSL